ncbi:site-specific integrase [Telluribacter sp. SYSU D00476]|uniref:tyrosine-type recombinase/integrase n=1 Tax=Telluribacter sp. SYSU D00476 TaxID=2811430 RepID=UPI001FF2EC08|nr:site-specific integrase [Telluribacter sp. SYSU D00476]
MQRTTNAKVYLDTRRQKKDKTYPVKLEIYFKGKQDLFSTGVSFSVNEYKTYESGKTIRNDLFFESKRRILDTLCINARKILESLTFYTREEFKERCFGKEKDPLDVFKALEAKIEQFEKEDRLKTAESYQLTLSALKGYTDNRGKLHFQQVTVDFLKSFQEWMRMNHRSTSTVGIYTRNLRAIFNELIDKDLIDSQLYPFGKNKFQPPTSINKKRALKLEDIRKISSYGYVEMSTTHRAIDFFLFSFNCNGMNMKDIALLRYKNIHGGYIRFVRQKTKNTNKKEKTIEVPINDEIQRIIDIWGRKPASADSLIFNIIEESMPSKTKQARINEFTNRINKKLNEVGKDLGIEYLKVTTVVARHTFSTILKNAGYPTEFIKESLGHDNVKTTENYLSSFEDNKKKEASQLLQSTIKG